MRRAEPSGLDREGGEGRESGQPGGSSILVLGIDEAGYGPLLGPLVVAGTAFRVRTTPGGRGAAGADGLAERLADAIAVPGARAAGRLVVGDSKAVFGPTKDLARLERPLLAFSHAIVPDVAPPRDLDALLTAVGADPAERRADPWYTAASPALPLHARATDVADDAARLRAALAAAQVEFVGFAADVVPEARLNRCFAARGNKAEVLFDASASVLDRLLSRRRPGEGVDAVLDRHGGRRFYLGPLTTRWPARFAWAVEETPRTSRYRVGLGDAEAALRFDVGADASAPQVGLASMLAKYLRETFMELWNGYFGGVCPGVAGTAGYAEDARRWLDETRAARLAAGIPDEKIVRVR